MSRGINVARIAAEVRFRLSRIENVRLALHQRLQRVRGCGAGGSWRQCHYGNVAGCPAVKSLAFLTKASIDPLDPCCETDCAKPSSEIDESAEEPRALLRRYEHCRHFEHGRTIGRIARGRASWARARKRRYEL